MKSYALKAFLEIPKLILTKAKICEKNKTECILS